MPSAVDLAKRELVKVLKELAAKYSITFAFTLTRESSDKDVIKAFRRVSLKVHPDKKGDVQDFQKLSATNDAWQDLLKNAPAPGRPANAQRPERPRSGKPWTVRVAAEQSLCRVRGQAVLLTYQSFSPHLPTMLLVWQRFVSFVEGKLKEWGVKFWTATAETNENARHHLHLMLQFHKADEQRYSKLYAFEGVMPNASAHDLLGEGFGGKRFRSSVCSPSRPPEPQRHGRPAKPTAMPWLTPLVKLAPACFRLVGLRHRKGKHKTEF